MCHTSAWAGLGNASLRVALLAITALGAGAYRDFEAKVVQNLREREID